jgi:hypothetical protein
VDRITNSLYSTQFGHKFDGSFTMKTSNKPARHVHFQAQRNQYQRYDQSSPQQPVQQAEIVVVAASAEEAVGRDDDSDGATEATPLFHRRCDNLDDLYELQNSETRPAAINMLGVMYCICVAMFTVIQVVLFLGADSFASDIGDISTALVEKEMYWAFSIAAAIGTFAVPILLLFLSSRTILLALLLAASCALLLLTHVGDKRFLFVMSGIIGSIVGIGNTLCQIMTRKLHRRNAGFWISVNGVAYTVFNASSVVVDAFTSSIIPQLLFAASLSFFTISCVMMSPNYVEEESNSAGPNNADKMELMTTSSQRPQGTKRCLAIVPLEAAVPQFYVEYIAAAILFLLIGNELILGGNCSTSDILNRYVYIADESTCLVNYFTFLCSYQVYR